MHNVIKKSVMFASVVALAASTMNCANSPEQSNANVLAPSSVGEAALAARGGGGKPSGGGTPVGGGTLSTPKMVADLNGDGQPSFRDTVTFVVQTTSTAYPYVTLRCYQGGTLVSSDSNAMFTHSLDQNFTLGPTGAWTGGAANCTANLENRDAKNGSIVVLASTSFTTN
jgi:hypothetical protein